MAVCAGHKDSVVCVMAVCAGHKDSVACVMAVCAGHKDSVVCAAFNHDSASVATGDMAGLIKVWSVDSQQEVWSYEVDDLEASSLHSFALAYTPTG